MGERYLPIEELEAWIVDLAAQLNGAQRLNDLRDRARRLAVALHLEPAAERLDELVSAALTTGPASVAQSEVLRAWATGAPYDRVRIERFEQLAAYLDELAPDPLPALPVDVERRRLLPFYEAYFSNYIEGTRFSIEEAAQIVFDEHVPQERPKDAHDVVGTYRIVSDEAQMRRIPQTADELIDLLRERHATILEARPDTSPGRFKNVPNQAGSTRFVDPDLVDATLRAGFDAGSRLTDPFARAVFMMFLVVEVHPFVDGNGRIARIMMNAEFVKADEVRVIIPTVYRLNYVAALEGAIHNDQFAALA